MDRPKSKTLRRKLFILILSSMLVLMVCMGGSFYLLTQSIETEEQQVLNDFSGEMTDAYSEYQKNGFLTDSRRYASLFSYMIHETVVSASRGEYFCWECDDAMELYLSTMQQTEPDALFLVYYEDQMNELLYATDGRSGEDAFRLLEEIYTDANRTDSGTARAENALTWIKETDSDLFCIEEENRLTAVILTSTDCKLSDRPIRTVCIRECRDLDLINQTSQELIGSHVANAEQSHANVFRRAMMTMAAVALGILLLILLYTQRIARHVADPIELERLRAQREKEALEETNRMKTTFLSDVSHELKTPLAAMSGYAQNAETDVMNNSAPAFIQEKLRRISSEANRMALMVTQILDATRIEEGRMVLECAPCEVDALVRQTAETYFAVLNKNNNRLAVRIPVDLPKIYADSSRLQRVFVNLISNAMKHTHNGIIVVKAEQEDDMVRITVKDTGNGISPEDLPHIWERYYKGKHSETGTGLGLFITRFIVQSHGGTIDVESEIGKGTAFSFTIPCAKPEQPTFPV
ncbi:MAG: HAMP domain-containing histidine kinase [Oscillospiraceae bacterium]|nr:HAMP domain-containing histidine kinase [Oscillospiraceae bacterium]